MFALGVLKSDGWHVFEASCTDGKCLNLLADDDSLSYKKPNEIVYLFKNDRWRKDAENYIFVDNSFLRLYFCNYYKRIWNKNHPNKSIKQLRIIYMTKLTKPDYHYTIPEKQNFAIVTNSNKG